MTFTNATTRKAQLKSSCPSSLDVVSRATPTKTWKISELAPHSTAPHPTAQRSTLGVQTALSSESHIMLSLDFVSPSLLLPPSSHLGRLSPHHTFPSTCIGLLWHPILTACTSLYLCFTLYSQLHSLASPIISSLITAFRISHLVSHQHRALITRLHPFAR